MTIVRSLNELKYENKSAEFVLKQKSFQYQYAPLYAERLAKMRGEVSKAAKLKWPGYECKNLVDLVKNEKAVIIGTLYKDMKNKPNILKELAEDDENNGIPIQPVLDRDAKYIDEISDEIILEDEVQRILLIDAPKSDLIKSNKLCGGIVLAVLGYENEESKFEVEDICFKTTEFYTSLPKQIATKASKDDIHICLVSGLELGDTSKTASYLFKFQLLVDFLRGDFVHHGDNELTSLIKSTNRIIIAGNSLSSTTQSKDMINKAKYLTKNYVVGSVSAIKQLDEMLLELISHLDVDLMPGEFDPSNLMVPQQPLHHAMFTKSIESEHKRHLHSVTNPYRFVLGDTCLVGTSGQFIDDMRKSTSVDDPIELMKLSMQCGHLGPTCPDTLACYPYYGQDPFILDHLPDVYFVGNQNEYKHGVYETSNGRTVQLISLPKFSTSHSCVFLNLNTLESREIAF